MRKQRNLLRRRLFVFTLTVIVILSGIRWTPQNVHAANSIVDAIIAFANNTVGSSNYYINGQGYCQAFVKDCYEAAGIYASSNPGTATEAKNRWMVSTDLSNIPIGACIYYNLNHVSLYVGNNQIIHLRSGKICKDDRSINLYFDTDGDGSYESKLTEVGWGYQAGYNLYADTEAPVISNIQVTDLNATGYTVSCTVTDNAGVASVAFPTWTEANGQDDLASPWPSPTSINGSTYTYRVNIADHNNETGVYITHIWAYDVAGNSSSEGTSAIISTNPVVTSVVVTNVDKTGYTVTATATDDTGVTSMQFPTKRLDQGQDAWIWYQGTQNADGSYSARVNMSDFGSVDYTYQTVVYAFDAASNYSAGWEVQQYVDTTPPVITNTQITDVNNTGYTVTATVTDNIGTTKVRFPTKRMDQGDDAWQWYEGTRNEDGTYSYRVSIDVFSNWDGIYATHLYAYDACGNISESKMLEQYIDTTPPVVSDVKIKDVDGGGYTVQCTVTDNSGIAKVQFPSWTENNGQDDLSSDWDKDVTLVGAANGNIYTFRVKDIDHNFERGVYHTHIYAYDNYGNHGFAGIACDLQNEGKVVATQEYNGHVYQFIDDKVTWHEAKTACEAMGGNLVTITSAEEQALIESMLQEDTTCYGYFIGGYTENGVSKWVTGETFDYNNWYPGQPDGWSGSEVEDVYEMCSHRYPEDCVGKWNDIVADTAGYGYICEFDSTEVTNITLLEPEVEVGVGQTTTIEATISPEEGHFPPIIWTSANPSIATVSDGVITGVAAGTTTITAECGGKTDTCKVTVVKPFESITLNLADKTLFKNETCTLEVSFTPADANASKELVWTSANPEVATVDENGVVTAISAGTTTITAALEQNPQVSATCTVQVTSYVVTFDTKGGSSIAPQEYGKDEVLEVEEPTKSGYAFTGWYKDVECTIPWDMENDVVNGNITLYAGWMEYHEGLWIVEIPAQKYTGSAIKPKVEVYHYATKLTEGTDYKVSYKNNKNVCDKSSTLAPTVIVTGKGNYTGKETITFTISAKNFTDEDIEVDDIFLAANGKVQKPVPVVTWNGKKLRNNKDYAVAYPVATTGAYQNNGSYKVRIVGKGNFAGERTIQLHITSSNLMSKAKVSAIPSQAYTGKEIEPEFTVNYGPVALTKGVDYTVSYRNNVSAGTATVILTGMGSYSGEKKVTFKIKGTSMSQAEVTLMPESVVYTGKAIAVPYQLKLKDNPSVILKEGYDYTATYKNNTNAGTATITFKGINGYTGSIKETFKIARYNIEEDTAKSVRVKYATSVAYRKDGTVVEPKVTCNGKTLKKDVDYRLLFKNNKEIYSGTNSDKMPTIVISGRGNYIGNIELNFRITTQDIGLLAMTAPDKVYQSKAGKYASKPVIKDVNGKKLTAGKDYEKEFVYTYTANTTLADGTVRPAGSVIQASDILPAGTSVTVTAKGMGNYTGEISCTYRIVQADISKANGKIAAQIYTGQAIEPGKSDITLKVGKTTLASADYEIVSYSNNVQKGTATVVVKGVGNYGGTREIKFKIKSKVFSWWWR